MEKQELRQKISEVLDESKVGTLATVQGNKPHSRYMTFYHEDFTLYTPTSKQTHKTEEIENNPNVHVLLGYDGESYGDKYLEIEGAATVNETDELKKKLWNDEIAQWFEGPEDPNYVVLEIKPSEIRLMNDDSKDPAKLSFN